jgi:copper transport protein
MLLVACAAVLSPAAPAAAHAALVAATPAPGSVVASSPGEVTVTFSEPVTPVTGKVQVLAPDGKRISGTPTVRGTVLRIPVRQADRPLGTYLVSYRVISADSHPVAGGLTFSVGAPSVKPPTLPADDVHSAVTAALPVARYLSYAGLTLAVGPALFLAALWPRRLSRRWPVRMVRAGLVLIAVSTFAGLWLQAPYTSGAPLWRVSTGELGDVLGSGFGAAMTARLAVLGVLAALLPPLLHGRGGRWRGAAVTALAVAGLTTWPLTGHAAAAPLSAAVAAADVVHLAAMAVWLGGLITLAAFLLRTANARALAVIMPVWSRWAMLSVVWLVAGGTVQSVVQIGSLGALWGTDYGRLLLGKVAVLTAVLGAAAYARRLVLRPQAAGGPATVTVRLRRTVGAEVAATTLVLALSAVLVQTTPSRQDLGERPADAPAGVSQTLTSPLFTLQFNVYPVQLGENNTVHAFVYTPEGAPLPVQEWSVTTVLTDRDVEPVTARMLGVLPHHAIGAVTFPLPGVYELRFTARTTEVDQATVRTTVTVR